MIFSPNRNVNAMPAAIEPLSTNILALMYFGDAIFALSGALLAGRKRMDIIGFVLIGTITGIGGGTVRDLLLGRTVWWTQEPLELILCVVVSLIAFFVIPASVARRKWMTWADALGLAAFAVVGCHIALSAGAPAVVAVFMGMLTATGGGLIRDVITNEQPMITSGQLYATVALLGAACYAALRAAPVAEMTAESVAFLSCFLLRAAAIHFNIRMGPPGEFIRVGAVESQVDEPK
jgi:uncharacterized membrane protein YeiH